MVCGAPLRSVTSWHDSAKQRPASSRRTQPFGRDKSTRPQQQSPCSTADLQHPQRKTSRQQRSALRSAAHHKLMHLRALRSVWLVVRFLVRLSRLAVGSRAIRVESTGKRRHSPPPDVQQQHLHRLTVQRMVWVLKTRTRSYFVNDGSCVNTDFYMVYRGLAGPITPLQKHTSHRRYF